MRTAGIVAEYNPFHNGHQYLAAQARLQGATHLVAAMSGSFVQRGEAAFADKFLRAEAAVRGGVDLVLDLPAPWSLGGAASFARGAVAALADVGCDLLAFGCETDDADLLCRTALLLQQESVQAQAAQKMKQGATFPAALQQTLLEQNKTAEAAVLQTPNNVLAVEYIKAMSELGCAFELLPVRRIGPAHDALPADGTFASAAALRAMDDFSLAAAYMPAQAFCVYAEHPGRLLEKSSFETAVLTALRLLPDAAFSAFVDDGSGLADRIRSAVKTTASLDDLYQAAKTKSLTLSKVRREVMHLFLQIPPSFAKGTPPYLRPLACSPRGTEVLGASKHRLPLLTKHAEAAALPPDAAALYALQCRASDLYALCTKTKGACCTEQTSSFRIIR
ncbi:MAG: nucleotidyltransferase family protein [Clostridia bacterium]|nr:nucleotidyltransferase family protein [Clostridia bacterium]